MYCIVVFMTTQFCYNAVVVHDMCHESCLLLMGSGVYVVTSYLAILAMRILCSVIREATHIHCIYIKHM